MKKLIVLVAALLLVSMAAFAQSDVTFSGEVEQRWSMDLNNKSYYQAPVVEVKLDAVVDDTAKLYIELEEGATPGSAAPFDWGFAGPFDKANFTLDVGAIFDLPVGVTVITGIDEYDLFDAAKVTPGEFEDVIGTDWVLFGHQVDIAVNDMIAVRALWANDPGVIGYSFGVAVTYDPVYVEVGYVEVGSAELDPKDTGVGDVEVGAEFIQDVADGINVAVAASLDYDLNESTTDDSAFMYGAGVNVTYNEMITAGGAVRGMTDSELNSAQIDISIMPLETVTIFLFAGLGLDGDLYDDLFDSFEGSVMFMIGPSTWYAGLQWTSENSGNIVGIASEKDDFVTETQDEMAIFMRAELKY
jgi:hypothetical protein